MILGVDVWSGYGKIDWQRVAAAGVRFAFVKCTQGNDPGRDDARFAENVMGARNAGLYVGGYHYAYCLPPKEGRPGREPEEEARRAYVVSGALGTRPGELPPVVDAEHPEVGEWGKWECTAPQINDWLRRYCIEAERLWGRKPIIYTYPFWWRTIAASADVSWAKDYALWIASYKDIGEWMPKITTAPHSVAPWDGDWTFWQFSADKSPISIPGIPACPIDRDVFRGDLDGLRRLANIEPEAETQPSPSRRPPQITDLGDFRKVRAPLEFPERVYNLDDDPDDAA